MRNRSLWKVIFSFVESTNETFNWTHIRDYLIKKADISVDVKIIRRILKEKVGYSYKRCSSWPLKHNYNPSKLKKIMFSVKIWQMFYTSSILINVDEATFSSSTKAHYSWIKKGSPSNRSSLIFKGSVRIISAIM